jgi:predicted nucleic acid-binding protein
MSKDFLDTNIILYANDATDKRKQDLAIEIVAGGIREGSAVISTQVLQEYAVNAVGKLKQELPVVMHQLRLLEFMFIVPASPDLGRRGLEISGLFDINFWDALIVAAAEHARCDRILSEDLNPGQFYCGMECVDPFRLRRDHL